MIILVLFVILLIYLIYNNSFNYEHYTNDNQDILTKLKNLTLFVSHLNITIINNENILLKENNCDLVIYVIKNENSYFKQLNIDDNIQNIINDVNNDDIIIILKKICKIPPNNFFDMIKQIGGKFNIIRDNENYILVTNKNRTIYFELASTEPIYYPYIIVNSIDCRKNPKNIYPPKQYKFYGNKYFDNVERCAHEKQSLTHFALTDTVCTPLTEMEYDKIQKMPRTGDCTNSLGINESMSTYNTTKIYSFSDLYKNDLVTFFSESSGKGDKLFLKEGEYTENDFNRSNINSIYVPKNYYVFLLTDYDIIPFYGEILINVNAFSNKYYNRVIGIIIQKYVKGNVIVCGNFNKKQIWFTYGKGITVFHPKLQLKVLFVKMDNDIETVSLFGDISSINLIDTYTNNKPNTFVRVLYPRVTRSIKVI